MSNTALAAPGLRDAAILIVDDEEANVRLLSRLLARSGFARVRSTTDPREVVPLFRETSPDLILLDVRMPELDGFAVLAQLREIIPPTDFLPVLAITGDASSETRQRVLSAGANDFLEKPFEMAEVVAAAEAASLAKSQFLATMSHELRTPLNAVIGFSQHLQKNKAKNLLPQDLAFLQRIGDNGMHLLKIINDILDLSRVEAGKMQVDEAPIDLGRLIFDVIEQTTFESARATQVKSRISIPEGLRPLLSDDSKLRRILINLVGNATKFTERGHFSVAVQADPTGKPMRIDVLDSGIGIHAERLGVIFERFEQADKSTQRRFGGTGLGLAISRTLCELLGFRLTVVSELGVGSAFSVLLDPAATLPSSDDELVGMASSAS